MFWYFELLCDHDIKQIFKTMAPNAPTCLCMWEQ